MKAALIILIALVVIGWGLRWYFRRRAVIRANEMDALQESNVSAATTNNKEQDNVLRR